MIKTLTEKTTGKIQSIEIIRALSCLLVVFSHTAFGSGLGAVAINFFFIISGYVIMLSTENENKPYWKKRLAKILPLYYAMTLFTSFLILVMPELFKSYEFSPVYLIKTLLFIPYEHSGIEQPIMGLGWTLNYEMFFYLIFWISKKINHKNRGYIAFAVCAALSAAGLVLRNVRLLPFTYWCNSYLLTFGYGILLYQITRKRKRKTADESYVKTLMLYVIFALSVVLMTYIRKLLTEKGLNVLEGAVSGAVCFLVLAAAILTDSQIKKSSLLLYAAGISYPLYLMHIYPIRAVDVIAQKLGLSSALASAVGVLASIICCLIYDRVMKKIKEYIPSVLKKQQI